MSRLLPLLLLTLGLSTSAIAQTPAAAEADPRLHADGPGWRLQKREENVPTDDLGALMMQHLDLARGDRFHWKPEGTALLVKQVSSTLLQALAEPPRP